MSDSENLPEKTRSLPPAVEDALLDLTPKQRAAVVNYLDPESESFGNKTKSMLLAGYAKTTNVTATFGKDNVKHALALLREHQLGDVAQVMDNIRVAAPRAVDEVRRQLVMKQPAPIDPVDIFGEKLENMQGEDYDRLDGINRHNANVAKIMKEKRAAATFFVEYAEGTPEQRVSMKHSTDKSDLDKMLGKLSKEEFEELGRVLFGDEQQEQKKGSPAEASEPIEAEYEIED